MSIVRVEDLTVEQLDSALIDALDLGEFDTTSDWFTVDLIEEHGVNIRKLPGDNGWAAALSEHDPNGTWNEYRAVVEIKDLQPGEAYERFPQPRFAQCRFIDQELKRAVSKAVLASIAGDTIEINDEEQDDEQA